jgi:hypothetical protein
MPQIMTLGSSGKAKKFEYTGNELDGFVIKYAYGNVSIDSSFYRLILKTFRGKKIHGGFSRDNPTQGGLGEWVRDNSNHNSQQLTPQHASRVAAILVHEKKAESYLEGNKVIMTFDNSPQRPGAYLARR